MPLEARRLDHDCRLEQDLSRADGRFDLERLGETGRRELGRARCETLCSRGGDRACFRREGVRVTTVSPSLVSTAVGRPCRSPGCFSAHWLTAALFQSASPAAGPAAEASDGPARSQVAAARRASIAMRTAPFSRF